MRLLHMLGLLRPLADDAPPSRPATRPSDNSKLAELRSSLAGRGHPQFPFNHPTYSPESRVPAADFSPFIAGCLAQGDTAPVEELVESLIAGNPGLGTSGGWMAEIVQKVVALPLARVASADHPQFELELRALFILGSLSGGGWPFWLTGDKPSLFAQALSGYRTTFSDDIKTLRGRANSFIRRMRTDTPYWRAYPLFDAPKPVTADLVESPQLERFLKLPCSSRLHLFSLHHGGGGALARVSGYSTRELGLDIEESTKLIVELGLVERCSHPAAFVATLSKKSLKGLLDQARVASRTSWTKARLAEELVAAAPGQAEAMAAELNLVRPTPPVAVILDLLSKRASELEPYYKLLCFLA